MIQILALLKNIKPIYIMVVLLGLSLMTTSYFYNKSEATKRELRRSETNFNQIINLKDSKLAELEFTSNSKLEEFLSTQKELQKIIKDKDIKIKHLNSITYQHQIYKDTVKEYVTEIVLKDSIKPFVHHWIKENECIKINGSLEYQEGVIRVSVDSTKFTNTNTVIGYMERPQKNWFTRTFGRLHTKVDVSSTCGESETIIITRKKKK